MSDQKPPRPSPSPHPEYPPELEAEEKTDPRMLAAISKYAAPASRLRELAVAVGAVGASVVVALIFIDNRVHAQTDAGVQVVTEKHEALKARVETLEKRFDRFESRSDQQMNLALDALRVPESKRPPPLDGGKP